VTARGTSPAVSPAVVLLTTFAVTLAAGALILSPSLGAVFGLGPRRVQVIYVREENSLGLVDLPSPGQETGSLIDPVEGRLVLPEGSGPLPRGTEAVVLRETFAAGVRVEARAIFVRRFPVTVTARPAGQGAGPPGDEGGAFMAPGCALLAVDLILDRVDGPAVRIEAPGLLAGSEPEPIAAFAVGQGMEWRLGAAVDGDSRVVVLRPDDVSYETVLRSAFYEGRPVSVISVTNLGLWDRDAIENPDG